MADDRTLEWQTESLRVTVFPASPLLKLDDLDWWRRAVEQEPQSRTTQPRIGQLQEIGLIGAGPAGLILTCTKDRIDWHFGRLPEQQAPDDLPICGAFSTTLNSFRSLVTNWLPEAPSTKRIAFGAELLAEVSDVRSGYLALQSYLPDIRLDPQSSDFSYSINRPRTSQDLAVKINRLSRWGVVILLRFKMGVPSESVVLQVPDSQWTACRLSLDINTDAAFSGELPHERLAEILDNLIAFGQEIAAQGDVP